MNGRADYPALNKYVAVMTLLYLQTLQLILIKLNNNKNETEDNLDVGRHPYHLRHYKHTG